MKRSADGTWKCKKLNLHCQFLHKAPSHIAELAVVSIPEMVTQEIKTNRSRIEPHVPFNADFGKIELLFDFVKVPIRKLIVSILFYTVNNRQR